MTARKAPRTAAVPFPANDTSVVPGVATVDPGGNVAALFALAANCKHPSDKRVVTPKGAGMLVQIFRSRAAVVLDAEPKKMVFFKPQEVTVERQ